MPEWKKEIEARLAPLHLEPVREAEIVEELSQHLNDRYDELVSRGVLTSIESGLDIPFEPRRLRHS